VEETNKWEMLVQRKRNVPGRSEGPLLKNLATRRLKDFNTGRVTCEIRERGRRGQRGRGRGVYATHNLNQFSEGSFLINLILWSQNLSERGKENYEKECENERANPQQV